MLVPSVQSLYNINVKNTNCSLYRKQHHSAKAEGPYRQKNSTEMRQDGCGGSIRRECLTISVNHQVRCGIVGTELLLDCKISRNFMFGGTSPMGLRGLLGIGHDFGGADSGCRDVLHGGRLDHTDNYCPRGEVAAATSVPIASPESTSSTRRFRWRPSGVSLPAIGCIFPKPRAVTAAAATP